MPDWLSWLEPVTRWIHVVAGILWIGLLYFFNWVNGPFAATMDGDTKKKVVPELMPRTLYWFRWGAAWTWFSGVLLLLLVFYHTHEVIEGKDPEGWNVGVFLMLAVVFLGVFLYDFLMTNVCKSGVASFFGGWFLTTVMLYLMSWAGFSTRGMAIHMGAMFGTFMAFNVWFRIWPAQQKIITAIKNGEAPDPSLPALAGCRSMHNTYMSIPLVYAMLNTHQVLFTTKPWHWSLVVLVGWWICRMLYKKSKKVPGF